MADQELEPRVEISGWDLSERFFVERARVVDLQERGKKVVLHREVRVGGLVFLRLLTHADAQMTFPVAFRVRELRQAQPGEMFEITLRQLWPRKEAAAAGTTDRVDEARPE